MAKEKQPTEQAATGNPYEENECPMCGRCHLKGEDFCRCLYCGCNYADLHCRRLSAVEFADGCPIRRVEFK